MSWISTNNLRRFADKLFHGKLSFGGDVTHNGATIFNGGVKVNTTKAEFTAPVSFTGTTTYKGNEIATKADITGGGGSIVVDDALSDTSTNPVQGKVIKAALDKMLSKSSGQTVGLGANTIEWGGDGSVNIINNSGSNGALTSLSPGLIYVGLDDENVIGIKVDALGNGIVSKIGRNFRHLNLGENLEYGLLSEEKSIATEDYVDSAIAAIASYDDTAF